MLYKVIKAYKNRKESNVYINRPLFFFCLQVSVPEFQYARGAGASLMMVSHKATIPPRRLSTWPDSASFFLNRK